jgi:hypothetical protein
LSDPDLTEMGIDTLIEELRPLRMKIRTIDYGSTPGFRNYNEGNDEKSCSNQI